MGNGYVMRNGHVASVPFSIREQPAMSQSFFLDALVSLIPKVLPSVLPLLGSLFGGRGNGSGPAPAAAPAAAGAAQQQILQAVGNPQIAQLIATLIQQLIPGVAAAGPGSGARPATATPAPAPAPGAQPAVAQSLSAYSNAMVFPIAAIAAALPALMPLLQQALNPETIKAITSVADPSKLIGTVTDSLKQFAGIGLQANQQVLDHLRALTPSVDDPALDQLLAGMSVNVSTPGPELRYRRARAVRLHFADLSPQTIHGRSRLAYRQDMDLSFPLSVETPQTINRAVLQVLLKDPKTLKILGEQKYRVEQAAQGRLEAVPRLSREKIAELLTGEDYLLTAVLVWKKKSGEKIGTSITQLITLVSEFSFDRVEESSELIPLNDVQKFRDFWHKAWQGSFSKERKRLVFDCKYYYALEAERDSNAQMETVFKTEETGVHKEEGRLKTGLLVSPFALNHLIPAISSYPMLGEAEMAALRSPDFTNRFSQAARVKVKLSGRVGDSAALWVYPEMKMQQVVLVRAEQTNAAGHVLQFSEQRVHFPMPMLVHFIGASTRV